MKRTILSLIATATFSIVYLPTSAQSGLAPDQNPNYQQSLERYLLMSDSINKWHSTTQHEMYKAIDWLADRKEARADRREFRRQLRMERASRYDNYLHYNGYYYDRYNRHYRPHWRRSFGLNPYYGLNFWWR